VKTGIQSLKIVTPGFLLEFIPVNTGAGMKNPKNTNLTFRNLKTHKKYRKNCPFSLKISLIGVAMKSNHASLFHNP